MGCDVHAGASLQKVGRFQSTHPHGVRPMPVPTFARLWMFQSTHPHGVRPFEQVSDTQSKGVSIHAPAWGATVYDQLVRQVVFGFNPRTRMGCDGRKHLQVNQQQKFQSTHPHGVRLYHQLGGGSGKNVSIHAPAWGATVK